MNHQIELRSDNAAGVAPPLAAHRIGKAREAGEAPLLLDGEPLSETDRLGYEHR